MSRFEGQVDRDAGREPCPDRIVEDLGSAFGMGCIGGFIWHFVKGYRNSPKGERLGGAMFSAKTRAPILGGNFAVWGGTFSSFDCTLQYIRRRDDHWNNIASGFLTGGVLAARAGWKQAGRNAVMGGVILAIIEGVAALLVKSTSKSPREQQLEQLEFEKQQLEFQKQQHDMAQNGGPPQDGGMLGSLGNLGASVFGSGMASSGGVDAPSSSSSSGGMATGPSEFATEKPAFQAEVGSGGFSSNGGLLAEGGLISEGSEANGEAKKSSWGSFF